MKEKTLKEHMSAAAKARWAKVSKEERSEYGKRMVAAREAKRAHRNIRGTVPATIPESEAK